MQCPSCHGNILKPILLTGDLSARKCMNCRGVLIDLLSYRAWFKNNEGATASGEVSEVSDSSQALRCPKCSHIMLKFRISGEHENRVDVCTYCDEAWLDEGEWELLGSLALQSRLTSIFTEPWQRSIRAEQFQESRRLEHEAALGEGDYAEIQRVKEWIDKHPERQRLLRILMAK